MTTLIISLLVMIGIATYWYFQILKYKMRLKKKDAMIEVLFAGLPHLFSNIPGEIAYSIQVSPEYNSDYIRVKYFCSDITSRCRLFSYFTWLKEHGVKIVPEDMKPRIEPCVLHILHDEAGLEDTNDERRDTI